MSHKSKRCIVLFILYIKPHPPRGNSERIQNTNISSKRTRQTLAIIRLGRLCVTTGGTDGGWLVRISPGEGDQLHTPLDLSHAEPC